MAAPFISLNHVSIRLGQDAMLEDVCWEMRADQHWAVIGPNGSGKSTLMRALSGGLPVCKGKIIYHWAEGAGHGAAQDRTAYVTFDNQRRVLGDEAFYQERWNVGMNEDGPTVADHLAESTVRRINQFHVVTDRSDPEFAARRARVVEALELNGLLRRTLVQLSNGERRKVTIARALLTDPCLLILDSPFAGLDERFRGKLAENLDNLMRGAVRVIIVGTERDEIPPGITHALLMHDHRIVAQGPRQDVVASHPSVTQGEGRLSMLQVHPGGDHENKPTGVQRPLVQMRDVTVRYNGNPVLEQVNWTVCEGEQWALLGPNGAGKTTLLSLILADNPQGYANDIMLFGRRRGSGESIWEIKRHIGWMAPELQLYYPRTATCLDVVCSGWFDSVGLYRECSLEQREIGMGWLRRFGLAERAGTAFEKLSEGEQRLVLLARALLKTPTLVVLDEPCAGLDLENRDRVLQAIDWVGGQSNTSMIYVTHRADELPQTITHVLRLDAGQVVCAGEMPAS